MVLDSCCFRKIFLFNSSLPSSYLKSHFTIITILTILQLLFVSLNLVYYIAIYYPHSFFHLSLLQEEEEEEEKVIQVFLKSRGSRHH